MHRIGYLIVTAYSLIATSIHATPPTIQPPLEVRLAKMKVIVVGQLRVEGKLKNKKVTLEISQILKCPADVMGIKPKTKLNVTPRPVGFSDQDGDGVWSLDLDRDDGRLIVSKYEFITYAPAEYEDIKKAIDAQNEPTKKAAERASALKKNLKFFNLQLSYHGPQDKPYYGLTLSVLPVPSRAINPFYPAILIDEDQAARIIDHLAKDGFFDQATDPRLEKRRPLTTPGYLLRVTGEEIMWHAELGWDLAMLQRLDDLNAVLDGKAAMATEMLIARLSGHRREWEKQTGVKNAGK